jgi:hypothetical protein
MNLPRFGLFGIFVLTLAAGSTCGAVHGGAPVRGLRDAGDWVNHTQDAANLIARIYRRAVDAETGSAASC